MQESRKLVTFLDVRRTFWLFVSFVGDANVHSSTLSVLPVVSGSCKRMIP